MRMTTALAALLSMMFVYCAQAMNASGVRKTVEMSMLVTGHLEIEPNGQVSRYVLDHPEKLPPHVKSNLAKHVPHWRFEPVLVEGRPVTARVKLGIRMRALPVGNGDYRVGIASASFGDEYAKAEARAQSISMTPPVYPMAAVQGGYQGTVYLILKIDRDGHVAEVAIEQVNMTVLGDSRQMERGRELLARASERAAKAWKFRPATTEGDIDQPFWSARVPVEFKINDNPKQPTYGQWEAYVPGPRFIPSWVKPDMAGGSPDALVAGGVYPIGSGPRLLTPLQLAPAG